MFGKSKNNAVENETSLAAEDDAHDTLTRILQRVPPTPEAMINSDVSIVGKLICNGSVAIFGFLDGELCGSSVRVGDGAQVEGNIVAEELTIDGRVKGTIRANRVKLNRTAVVEGDIYHRSLAIEENAKFVGMSQRQENAIDMPSLVPAKPPQSQAGSSHVGEQPNDISADLDSRRPPSADRDARSDGVSDPLRS